MARYLHTHIEDASYRYINLLILYNSNELTDSTHPESPHSLEHIPVHLDHFIHPLGCSHLHPHHDIRDHGEVLFAW